MSVSQAEVDAWFAANPSATSDQVAAAVQSIGGLDANAGLADMLAGRYGVDTSEVQNYYTNFTAPAATGALTQANTVNNTAVDNTALANSLDFSSNNLSGLQTIGGSGLSGVNTVQTDGGGAGSTAGSSTTNTVGALDQANATATGSSDVIQNLTTQILGQGYADKWTGEGFGSAEANAADMARLLNTIDVKDINDFGLVTTKADVAVTPVYEYRMENRGGDEGLVRVPYIVGYTDKDGKPVDASLVTQGTATSGGDNSDVVATYTAPIGTQQVYGNKKTGQVLDAQYDRANVDRGIFSGTFAGDDSTHYGVQFTADGKPIFYTQKGESTSDAATLIPIISLGLNLLLPGAGAAVGAALGATGATATIIGNAVIQGALAEAGGGKFITGALGSVAGGVAGNYITPEIANALGNTDVANVVAKTITGGALAAINGQDAGAGALAGGVGAAASLALPNIPGFSELSTGAKNSIVNLATSLVTNGTITEAQALNALGGIVSSTLQTGSVPNAADFDAGHFLPGGEGYVQTTTDDTGVDAGSTAYVNARRAGATETEALDAANAVTGSTGNTGATGATRSIGSATTTSGTSNNVAADGGGDAVTTVTGGAGSDTVTGRSVKDTEFGDLQGAITTNAVDDAVRADKLNSISSLPKFSDAYSQARDLLGAGKTFTWNGKEYSTATAAERPDLATTTTTGAGAGRGSYLGYNSAEDAASKANLTVPKTNELLGYINDTQGGGYDALGNPIGGQTIGASADLNTTSGKIANGVANAMTTFLGVVANAPVDAVRAGGNLLSNAGGIVDLVAGKSTDAGNKLRGLSDQIESFTTSISDPKIKTQQQAIGSAIDKAEGLTGKTAALLSSAWDNPLGAASWVFTEGFEEVPGVGLALKAGSKLGTYGIAIANDMMESGGSAYNDTYKAAIKQGMSEDDARVAARNSSLAAMAVTGVTQGVVEGKLLNNVIGKNTTGELVEGSLQSGATQIALGQDVSLDKMLTQGVIEAGVGKGASSTANAVTATNIGADTATAAATGAAAGAATGAATTGGASTGSTTGTTNLGSVGAEVPGAKTTVSNDLGAIGSVTPGGDVAVTGSTATGDVGTATVTGDTAATGATSTSDIASNVTTQIGSGADASTVVGNTVTGAIGAGSNANTAITSTVTSSINAGADASTVVGSAVTSAVTAGANVDTSVASSVSASIAAGTNANTAVTAAADAAIAAGNNVTVASNANTTTVTNATTNTTTTVNNTTGVATTVDANTNVTTTVDAKTGTTTAVDANTNVTTQTTVNASNNTTVSTTVDANNNTTTQTTTDANNNTQTTVNTNVNTNTQTTVVTNTDTGEVVKEIETVIPDGWTPPVIDTPVIPGVKTTPDVKTTTDTKTTPSTKTTSAAKLGGAGAALAGGAMGLPSGFDMDPSSLASRETQGRIDPLARVKEAQAELERDLMMNQIDPRLLSVMQQRMDPNQQSKQLEQDTGALTKMLSGESPNPSAPANQGKYYAYGSEDSIDDILGGKAANYKEGGFVEPLKASGGMVLPLLAKSGGALGKYNGREDFKGGKHVAGEGDGQSDDIPAWLADGEFVFPADVVSALGNGSTKAGTDKLYEMMHGIRDRARSKGPKDLPPPALKSALDYLKSSKRSSK